MRVCGSRRPCYSLSLLRTTSNGSSLQSYLSPHHSDDYILGLDLETPLPSPAVWEAPTNEMTHIERKESPEIQEIKISLYAVL